MSAPPPLVLVRTRKSRGQLTREAQAPALPGFRLIRGAGAQAQDVVLRNGCDTPDRGGRKSIGPAISKRYDERESDEAMAGQKIRIRLKSYDHEVIDSSARKIVDTVTRAGATVVGPVPLPTEKNVFVVIRSPHKYKDSREQFEMRTHKRLIDIVDPTPKAVDSLMRLDLPAEVNIEIKL